MHLHLPGCMGLAGKGSSKDDFLLDEVHQLRTCSYEHGLDGGLVDEVGDLPVGEVGQGLVAVIVKLWGKWGKWGWGMGNGEGG